MLTAQWPDVCIISHSSIVSAWCYYCIIELKLCSHINKQTPCQSPFPFLSLPSSKPRQDTQTFDLLRQTILVIFWAQTHFCTKNIQQTGSKSENQITRDTDLSTVTGSYVKCPKPQRYRNNTNLLHSVVWQRPVAQVCTTMQNISERNKVKLSIENTDPDEFFRVASPLADNAWCGNVEECCVTLRSHRLGQ